MADWRQIELDPRFDSELSRRRIMFIRAGTAISYPMSDQHLVEEVLKMLDAAVAAPEAEREKGALAQRVEVDRDFGPRTSNSSLIEFLESFGERCNLWFYVQRHMSPQRSEAAKGRVTVIPYGNLVGSNQGGHIDALSFDVGDGQTADIARYPMGAHSNVISPAGAGAIVFDDKGIGIAEVMPNLIALLVPVTQRQNLWSFSVLLRIFDRALPLALNEQKWEEQFESQKRHRLQRYREQYVQLVKSRSQGDMKRAENDLKGLVIERDNLTKSLTEAIREIDSLELQIGGLASRNGDFDTKARREFDKICEMQEIVGLAVDPAGIKALTTELLIDQKWKVGSFEIQIGLDSKVAIRNMTNAKKRGYETIDHPHVKMNTPCWGNIQSGVIKMISNYEFGAVLQTVLAYLQTYNPDDMWGAEHIPLWKDDKIKKGDADGTD